MTASLLEAITDHLGHRVDGAASDRLVATLAKLKGSLGLSAAEIEHRFKAGDADISRWLVDRLTISETYFFRSPEHFACLSRLAQAASSTGRPWSSAWSVGCSTGEEAWSLGITLGPHCPELRVVGTDVSEEALAIARAGSYGPYSFRETDPGQLRELLPGTAPGDRQVSLRLRGMTTFAPLNLARGPIAPPPPLPPLVDVVVCRNVLIYFKPSVARRAVAALAQAVAEGGVLLLGALETTLAEVPPGFTRLPDESAFVLRRDPRRAATVAPPPRPSGPPRPPPPPSALAQATLLADRRHWDEALRTLRASPELPATLFLEGVIQAERGAHDLARHSFARVLTLEPGHVPAGFYLLLVSAQLGDEPRVRALRAQLWPRVAAAADDEDFGVPGYRAGLIRKILLELGGPE